MRRTKTKNPMTPLVEYYSEKCISVLQQRNNLSQEDLEYVVLAVSKLKDERLKECVATLIGWGDEERAELETFCAISLEVLKTVNPSKVRNAAAMVELRYLAKKGRGEQK